MRFPRIGLIRHRTTDSVLATWNYSLSPEDIEDFDGPCPYVDFIPGQHEVVDLSGCTRDEYTTIAKQHHETFMTGLQQGGRALFRRGPNQTRVQHEIAALDDRRHGPKREPPPGGGPPERASTQ
jgi:hypothetical protein